jgi:GNAT superfamily N-acetyltransferase
MSIAYHYDDNFSEDVELRDGTRVMLRTIKPSDRQLLAQGFQHLSAESRYMRFFGVKPVLTEDDLDYLTDIDGVNHFAIGAVSVDEIGREQGLGVARFVRLVAEPDSAEPAIAVIDERQGLGIGTALAQCLVEAAVERGIRRFRIEFLAGNEPLIELIQSAMKDIPGATMDMGTEAGTVRALVKLPAVDRESRPRSRKAMRYLMGEVAKGSLVAKLTGQAGSQGRQDAKPQEDLNAKSQSREGAEED